jgi:nucleoside-diphosphate kinase
MERTLVLVKPDGVYRALIGRIISRFEDAGLKIVAIKMVKPDAERVGNHYASDEEWLMSTGSRTKKAYLAQGKEVEESEMEIGHRTRGKLLRSLTGNPVVAMVIEGNDAVYIVRKIAGATEPRTADPSSIRGSMSSDSYELSDAADRSVRNLVHASGSVKEAEREITVWFDKGEIVDYKRGDHDILY